MCVHTERFGCYRLIVEIFFLPFTYFLAISLLVSVSLSVGFTLLSFTEVKQAERQGEIGRKAGRNRKKESEIDRKVEINSESACVRLSE